MKEILKLKTQNSKLYYKLGRLWSKRRLRKFGLVLIAFCTLLLATLTLFSLFVFLPGKRAYSAFLKTYSHARPIKDAVKTQDLVWLKSELVEVQRDEAALRESLRPFSWLRFVPFANSYYGDLTHGLNAGEHGLKAAWVVIEAVEPFVDVLGFKTTGTAASSLTAESKIEGLVKVMPAIAARLDQLDPELAIIKEELDKIKPGRYPETIRGKRVRPYLTQARDLLNQVDAVRPDLKTILLTLPSVLGEPGEKKYVLIFQNDKEIRPTGGFWTAYALLTIRGGRIVEITSEDMYHLDERLPKVTPAPPVYRRDLKVDWWFIRDANLSPDFKASAEKFLEFWQRSAGAPPVDGVFAIDTYLVKELLEILGPVKPVGYAEEFNSENVIYQLELYATKIFEKRWDRKDLIGLLMHEILEKALRAPKEQWSELSRAVLASAGEKHLLFHFANPDAQSLVEKYNLAGRISEFEGDYLHVNDANFAGAKANLYVEESVNQLVARSADGKWVKEVTIDYENPEPYDGWLNGPYRDYVRIYVPRGSKLISSSGSAYPVETFEDLGKTVFAGFIVCQPKGGVSISFKYELPEGVVKGGVYRLLVQKQPGTDRNWHKISLSGKKIEEFELTRDREFNVPL